ncbi:MAG TPA: hypothetical protein VGN05_15230 [Parvibaculum sp.]|jgi:hypothetical protein
MRTNPSRLAIIAICLLGLVNLVRGSIHLFAPDGGLTSIAGLDLSTARETILFFIGAVGIGQISLGAIDLLAGFRYRAFVFPLLVVHLAETALGLFLFLFWRPLPVAVPGEYGTIFSFIAIGIITLRELLLGKNDAQN